MKAHYLNTRNLALAGIIIFSTMETGAIIAAGGGGGSGGAGGISGGGAGAAPGQAMPATTPSTPSTTPGQMPAGSGLQPTNGLGREDTNGGIPPNDQAPFTGNITVSNSMRLRGTNFFSPTGSNGLYNLGTNTGFLRGTNGFYRPGSNSMGGQFIPDGGNFYQRGPDGIYRSYNQDDTRGIYRNGVLYYSTNAMPATNGQ